MKTHFKFQFLTLTIVAVLFFSCKKDNDRFSTNKQITNELRFDLEPSTINGDTLVIKQDISAGVLEQVNRIISREEGASVRSIIISSINLYSNDGLPLAYLDKLNFYVRKADSSDLLNTEVPDDATHISSANQNDLSAASFNPTRVTTNVKPIFTQNDQYDMFISAHANQSAANFSGLHNIHVDITFNALIEN